MKFRIFPPKSIKLIIVTILLLLFTFLSAHAALWSNKVDTQDLQRIITELRIYNDPDLPYYNEIFRLYYQDSKELLNALNNKIEITQQAIKILDTGIKKDELGNLTYGRYILNAINEEELVEMGLKTGSPGQANGEYFSKLGENLADWKSQLSKLLITKIIGATCTAMGVPVLSIGISTLGLSCDLSIIGISINKLNEVWYEKAFWSYMQFRNDHNFDHISAWGSYAEPYVNHIFILSPEKQKKARKAIEENFKSLWNNYEEHIVNHELDKNFKIQQRESLKILLLYALGSEPHPIITSPLKITPPPPYQVGDMINAEFTIANQGMLPVNFSVLTVGGRDNDNQVADFSHRQNIILKPLESYDYKGNLTLNKLGNHHFFCTYQTPDDEWNTNVDVGSKLNDEDREEDIYVKEKIVNQPPDPPANLAQFESDGEIKISIGGKTDEHNIILKGKVSDPDGDKARLEVEIRRLNEYGGQFDEDTGGLKQSDIFENNSEIMLPVNELADSDYHWRARAIDEHGIVSEWISFGGNRDSAVDFTVGQEVVAPIITSPLKITPDPPYYVGDTTNAEFTITNQSSLPIKFSVLTVGGRDPDNHVSDFTLRQNITLEPSKSYNYQGTLALNKVGNYHFFCTYQTPDGEWNTNVDSGSGLTDEDRVEDIGVKERVEDKKEKVSFKTFYYKDECMEYSVEYPDWPDIVDNVVTSVNSDIIKLVEVGYSSDLSIHISISQDINYMPDKEIRAMLQEDVVEEATNKTGKTIEELIGKTRILKEENNIDSDYIEALIDFDSFAFKALKKGINKIIDCEQLHFLCKNIFTEENNKYFSVLILVSENKWEEYKDITYKIIDSMECEKKEEEKPKDTVYSESISVLTEWDKTFGGSKNDVAWSIIQTSDGGYSVAGYTESKGKGGRDFWIIKLDHQGNILWDKTFGGSENDWADSIIQTSDGGYAVAGYTSSKGAGKSDARVIKLDEKGNIEWDKTFGGSENDEAVSIIQTSDGGYAIAGATESKGAGEMDAWIIKLDHGGNIEWDKTFGGSENDEAVSIIQTSDGGYAIAGSTESKGAGKDDAWIIKLDHQGNKIWDKIYGGEEYDYANSLIQTCDGGYVVAGGNNSKGLGEVDAWIIKLDDRGNLEWDKIFGGDKYEWIVSLIQTIDGGYAIAGSTESKGAGKNDAWIIKLDHQGNKIWDKVYGGGEDDYAISLIQTSDGGYAIAGSTKSKGAGKADIWVIKLNSGIIEALEEEVTAMEALEDKIEKEIPTEAFLNQTKHENLSLDFVKLNGDFAVAVVRLEKNEYNRITAILAIKKLSPSDFKNHNESVMLTLDLIDDQGEIFHTIKSLFPGWTNYYKDISYKLPKGFIITVEYNTEAPALALNHIKTINLLEQKVNLIELALGPLESFDSTIHATERVQLNKWLDFRIDGIIDSALKDFQDLYIKGTIMNSSYDDKDVTINLSYQNKNGQLFYTDGASYKIGGKSSKVFALSLGSPVKMEDVRVCLISIDSLKDNRPLFILPIDDKISFIYPPTINYAGGPARKYYKVFYDPPRLKTFSRPSHLNDFVWETKVEMHRVGYTSHAYFKFVMSFDKGEGTLIMGIYSNTGNPIEEDMNSGHYKLGPTIVFPDEATSASFYIDFSEKPRY